MKKNGADLKDSTKKSLRKTKIDFQQVPVVMSTHVVDTVVFHVQLLPLCAMLVVS
jgi:hypothetical protein